MDIADYFISDYNQYFYRYTVSNEKQSDNKGVVRIDKPRRRIIT